jgi:hypothetical protein
LKSKERLKYLRAHDPNSYNDDGGYSNSYHENSGGRN